MPVPAMACPCRRGGFGRLDVNSACIKGKRGAARMYDTGAGGMPGTRQQMTAMNRGDNSVAPSIPQFRTTLLRWARLPLPVRLRRDPQIRLLRREPLREPCLRFLIRDGAGDDHVVPVLPVGRRGHGVVG